jgi:RNA polymerase sigma-70 factor, ECF subfamily
MAASDRVGHEQSLRRAVLRGDAHAWQTLYDSAFPDVLAYVQWRCAGLSDLADDITQETWLVAVRRIRTFEPERGSFAGWLCGIAANLLRNHFRANQPATNRPLPDKAAQAGGDLERREQAERVARVLSELPERYEAALRAKYLEQRSVEQIALLWCETPKAVESLLSRARGAFREAYGLPEHLEESIREANHERTT